MSSNIKVQRICQYCGKEFLARTTVTKCCGDECARRAYKARKREEAVEKSNIEMQMIRNEPFDDLLKRDDSKKKTVASLEYLKKKDFLTIAETCQLLSISRWTIWRAISNDQLVAAKIGRRTLIRRTDLDQLFGDILLNKPGSVDQRAKPSTTKFADFDISDSYTLTEIQQKYNISESAVQKLIQRNNIPKIKKGWYAYVPKAIIDNLLK